MQDAVYGQDGQCLAQAEQIGVVLQAVCKHDRLGAQLVLLRNAVERIAGFDRMGHDVEARPIGDQCIGDGGAHQRHCLGRDILISLLSRDG